MQSEPRHARMTVWALPGSLAATSGIDVSFSSSGYLDVSVHRVPLHTLWIQIWIHGGLQTVGAPYECDRVLFVERSGELRDLARLST